MALWDCYSAVLTGYLLCLQTDGREPLGPLAQKWAAGALEPLSPSPYGLGASPLNVVTACDLSRGAWGARLLTPWPVTSCKSSSDLGK